MLSPSPTLYRHHELFNQLTPTDLQILAEQAKSIVVAKHEYLFLQHDPAHHFYYVVNGCISLRRQLEGGEERVVELISTGQSFAEALMFLNISRFPVAAQAEQKSVVIQFESALYRSLLTASTENCLQLLGSFSRRIHQLFNELNEAALLTANQRLASYLLKLSRQQRSLVVQLPASKQTIASRLSIQPETLSRLMYQFQQEQIIACHHHQLTILNRAQLESYSLDC